MLRAAAGRVLNKRKGQLPFFNSSQCYSSEINLPSQADVVIIGGGSIGCNTLYQLSKRGVNAVLLERNKITSGTTWHTGGIVWRLAYTDVDIQLLSASRNQLLTLEEETGYNSGFINTGSLFLAKNKERLRELKRLHTMGYYFDVETQLLSPSDAAKIHPLLNPKSFIGALHSPGDGCVDPTILCDALTKGAIKNGAQVIENCPVTNIKIDSTSGYKKVIGVDTERGFIKTNYVLNAAGAWSRSVAQMVGLDIPLLPIQHAYVITESIPGAKGAPNVRDRDASIYYRSQGDSLYIGGYEINPHIIKDLPKDYAFGLYELDFNVFGVHMEKAYELMPTVKDVGIKSNICGPESFTPDHKPLLGEDPKLKGFFYACGLNSAGMMYGPGIAEQVALWIIKGRPELPLFNYDIRRFTPEMKNDRAWVTEKCHETYATHHGISFVHDQPLAGRNFKIDVFHEILVANGAVMEQSQGWEIPGFFIKNSTAPVRVYDWHGFYDHVDNPDKRYEKQLEGDCTFEFSKHHALIGEEALAARANVALFNTSYFCKMYLTGPDAQKAADWLFTAHTDQEAEKIVYTCTLNKNGGTEGEVVIVGLNQGLGTLVGPILKGRGYYIVANGASGYHIITHLKREIQKKQFKAMITDVTDKLGMLSIQGPKSRDIIQSITESPITDEKLPFGMSDIITVHGHTCRISRISFIGELGYELHIPYSSCIPVYNKLADVGRSFDMKLAGFRAMNSLNMEKGQHMWNKDLRIDDNPVEANLARLCRNEGCYLGKEHVDRLKEEGVDKVRAFFTIKDKIPLWGYETIWRDDEIVGYLRRAEYGYYLNASIGTGYIRHPKNKKVTQEYLTKGQYEIEIMGKRYPAHLFLKSPFDPKHQRVSGHYEHHLQEEIHFED